MEGYEYEFCKDHADIEKNAEGERGRERVDIFGEGGEKKARREQKIAPLPVKSTPGAAKPRAATKKNRASIISLAVTVLLLTTAFTALAYSLTAGAGNDPREAAGGIAGRLIFGGTDSRPVAASVAADPSVSVGDAASAQGTGAEPTAAVSEEIAEPTAAVPETGGDATEDNGATEKEPATDTSAAEPPQTYPGLVNKTDLDISLDALAKKWGASVGAELKGAGVLVVCTHPSECFADGTPVVRAAEAFCQALNAVGVNAVQCAGDFDGSGRLGSYSRAREAIGNMLEGGGFGLVVDLHIGDAPGLLVGTNQAKADDEGWQMNAALAAMVNEKLDTYSGSVTVDTGRYNQDMPVLSLHAELDGSLSSSRGLRSARILADSVIRVMRQ